MPWVTTTWCTNAGTVLTPDDGQQTRSTAAADGNLTQTALSSLGPPRHQLLEPTKQDHLDVGTGDGDEGASSQPEQPLVRKTQQRAVNQYSTHQEQLMPHQRSSSQVMRKSRSPHQKVALPLRGGPRQPLGRAGTGAGRPCLPDGRGDPYKAAREHDRLDRLAKCTCRTAQIHLSRPAPRLGHGVWLPPMPTSRILT